MCKKVIFSFTIFSRTFVIFTFCDSNLDSTKIELRNSGKSDIVTKEDLGKRAEIVKVEIMGLVPRMFHACSTHPSCVSEEIGRLRWVHLDIRASVRC